MFNCSIWSSASCRENGIVVAASFKNIGLSHTYEQSPSPTNKNVHLFVFILLAQYLKKLEKFVLTWRRNVSFLRISSISSLGT